VVSSDTPFGLATNFSEYKNKPFQKAEAASKKRELQGIQFDIVMANPPFAGDIKESRIIAKYELGKKPNGKWQNKVGRDILFIERNLDMLKPGGRMAIVLPQGRFNNSSDKNIRDFIAERCRILAVVGLHQNTFKPHTGLVSDLRIDAEVYQKRYVTIDTVLSKKMTATIYSAGSAQAELYPKDIDQFLIPFVEEKIQNEICQKVEQSLELRKKSRKLLDIAKEGVEKAIEVNEAFATDWIESHLSELGVELKVGKVTLSQ